MKRLVLSLLVLAGSCCATLAAPLDTLSTTPPVPKTAPQKKKAFVKVEQAPQYVNGDQMLLQEISRIIRYPEACIKENISGTVCLQFTVNRKGKIQGVKVVKSLHPAADAEAVRVVQSLKGKWRPARKKGKAVDANFILPIRFAIR